MDRILTVDDDVGLTELLAEYLEPEGFVLDAVHDGETGVARILEGNYALVVLDLMLPGIGGVEVLRRVREKSRIPIILLTARQATMDRILGLEAGADDYLPKPFDPRELVARVRSVLRRARPPEGGPSGEFLTMDDLSLDSGKREVRVENRRLELTTAEFDLLRALLASAGQVVSRESLSRSVLNREFSPYDRSIDNLVSSLRKKLGTAPDGSERIKTIRGTGYIFARASEHQNIA
ncbi:response regulator transcription factor [Verrucomicrobiota bacterium sgz303538]